MWTLTAFPCLLLIVQNVYSNELADGQDYQHPFGLMNTEETLDDLDYLQQLQSLNTGSSDSIFTQVNSEPKDHDQLDHLFGEPGKRTKFSSWGGKRAFSAWGGKRIPYMGRLNKQKSISLEDMIIRALGIDAKPKRDFEELEGPRDRRGVGFSAWGGKRSLPKSDSSNAEDPKASGKVVRPSRAAFSAWGGRR